MNGSPTVLVHGKGLRKEYGSGDGLVRALDAVDLDVNRGEILAVMGRRRQIDPVPRARRARPPELG